MLSAITSNKALIFFFTSQLCASINAFIFGQLPRCVSQCAYEYFPVCGSDGVTYPNLCFLFVASCRNANLGLVRTGPCIVPDPCNIACNRGYDPVCGSNGVTYTNPCILMYASCLLPSQSITRSYSGRCNTSFGDTPLFFATPPSTRPPNGNIPCPIFCTREYIPVCGSDGITYPNQCSFNVVACTNRSLTLVKEGACDQQTIVTTFRPRCPVSCSKLYDPVCGSDGVTYSNLCLFTKSSCLDPSLTKVKDGACDTIQFTTTAVFPPFNIITTPSTSINSVNTDTDFCSKNCPFDYKPLCGTDGITYTNTCTYDVAVCRNSALGLKYSGSCF